MAQLTSEFLDESLERVGTLSTMYEQARAKNLDSAKALAAFRRDLHTLKGQGGSYGYPSISLIAHRFEEFLLDFEDGDDWCVDGVQVYLDALERVIQGRQEPSPNAVTAILKALPASISAPNSEMNVVWVCEARVIRHKVRRDLESFGFNVITMSDPFDALRYICKALPEFVICSATLGGMTGFDLIRVLATITDTAHIPSILVTSFDAGHEKIAGLPKHVPVVKLTPNIGDELAHALSGLEFKRINPGANVRKD